MYVSMYVRVYVCTCFVHVCMYARMYVNKYVCVYVCMRLMYVCMQVGMCVCM